MHGMRKQKKISILIVLLFYNADGNNELWKYFSVTIINYTVIDMIIRAHIFFEKANTYTKNLVFMYTMYCIILYYLVFTVNYFPLSFISSWQQGYFVMYTVAIEIS
jgi:hypothetical protein